MPDIFQTPATISKVTSMANRSIRLQIDTQEALTDEAMAKLMSKLEKYGHFCFLEDSEISLDHVIDLPSLPKRDEGKSPSQRLHAVLFLLWKQNGENGLFQTYYETQMEKFIDYLKERLT